MRGRAMDSSFKAEKLLSELHRVCLQTSGNKKIDGYWASGCKRFKECLKDSISNCPVLWRLSKTFTDNLQTTPRGNLPTLPRLWNSSETIMCSAYPGTWTASEFLLIYFIAHMQKWGGESCKDQFFSNIQDSFPYEPGHSLSEKHTK